MQRHLDQPRLLVCELALVLLIAVGIGSCSRGGDADRYHFPPGVPAELIHHLTSSDDSTLNTFVLDAGWQESMNTLSIIEKQEIDLCLSGREQDAFELMRLRKRLAGAFASVYYTPYVLDDIEYMENLSREDLRTVRSLRSQFYRTRDDYGAPIDEQLERAFYFLHEFERLGDRLHTAGSKSRIAAAFDALGNQSEYLRYLRDAISDYIEIGQTRMACQELGVLGTIFEQSGEIDSMLACYALAQRLADRSRHPEQSARLRTFYAHYYATHGRLPLAYDLFNEAMDVCRDFKGGPIELRYIYEAIAFNIDLGCYDVAEKLLQRARLVRRQTKPDEINKFISDFHYVLYRADYLEARTEMGLGHLEDAERLMRRTATEMEKRPAPHRHRDEYVRLYYYWAQGLFDSGRYEKAAMIGEEALQRARKVSAPVWAARSALLLAKTRWALGDLSASQRHLDEFESLARAREDDLLSESILRHCLRGEIALANSDRPRALGALAAAVGEIEGVAADMDASVHGYLWLNSCADLRRFLHALSANDPIAEYGVELYWRRLPLKLGEGARRNSTIPRAPQAPARRHAPTQTGEYILSQCRLDATVAMKAVAEANAVHCVYWIDGSDVVRLTLSGSGARSERVGIGTEDLRTLAVRTLAAISHADSADHAQEWPRLQSDLRSLANHLLPPEVLGPAAVRQERLFLVTRDAFLDRIPFEAFDVGLRSDYVPLLEKCDVAYARCLPTGQHRSGSGKGIVVLYTGPQSDLRRHYPFQSQLHAAFSEAQAAASAYPQTTLLAGAAATKSAVLSAWEDASILHFATHTLRDPESPYMMLIPLASGGDQSHPDEAFLDVTDIRSADLTRADLVILSGCASGMPYVGPQAVGPSLAGAFLDAGAKAVVQTCWPIRDDEASELMTAFVRQWPKADPSAIHALGEIRRAAFRSSSGANHPFKWTAYTIAVSGP